MTGNTASTPSIAASAVPHGTAAWSGYLSAWQMPGAAMAPSPLGPEETARLERYRDRLLAAWEARDQDALRTAKQAVLRTVCMRPMRSPVFTQALRVLSWRMAALRLGRSRV
ncbi:hypothetical protein [Acidovorax sp. PRC11]|uniref:hypothetical protein n=1 Tax=Acidovorax sp. PRC11 TaxID=2962592 RepID=UPI002880CF0B|nr:hypothetical protein [Acidovorax sp. PRC11]MDT0139891.1 hypothetical protein [Acidovorax sp. PRC11]